MNSQHDLKRLEEQIFLYKPSIKSAEKKKHVRECLQNQLIHSKAVVKIQRMDAECESLMISLKQRLLLLQDFLIPINEQPSTQQKQVASKDKNELKSYLSSESSDDETLCALISRQKSEESQNSKSQKDKAKTTEVQHAAACETSDTFIPLALRREPRERRLSYKSYSSSSTSHSRTNRKKICNKQEQTVTTSSVTFSSDDILEEQIDATPTLHIKIPSLHRGKVHYLILDSLNFARKVFDYRANEVKQQTQHEQRSIKQSSRTSKTHRNTINCSRDTALQQLTQQEQDFGLSQLIQDVMNDACNDETLQATNALESINNNLIDNYDLVENGSFINYSQSSQEFSFSQNSNVIVDQICSTSEGAKKCKKPRKYTKRSNEFKQNEPPKKRGRKPKQRNYTDTIESQSPTKSNLAQYVELFSNDCELLPGSTTPAASSTKSQHLVSSTTHNYEIVDQLQQQQSSSQPITYYIDGDWANGGPCQLVTSNSMAVEETECKTNDNAPFQDFVNYMENSENSPNNDIATVVDCNHSLPVSIPRSIANFAFQNKNSSQLTHQLRHQPTVQNSLLPVINIQIPPLPNNISSDEPPPAHAHEDVVDLSIKSKENVTSVIANLREFVAPASFGSNDECMPLDLSASGKYAKEKTPENNFITIDTQDEEFIRRLIEQSDFEFRSDGMKKGSDNEMSVYDHENVKSFKAALDMPILDFDATELAGLVENTGSTIAEEQSILTDKIAYNNSTNNDDSNYVSMDAINSSVENNLHFNDQSTTEIINKLLDIGPENSFLNDANNPLMATDDLGESVFDHCRIENSTMCDAENLTTQKVEEREVCNSISDKDNQEIENNTSSDQPTSSTSLAVQMDCCNLATDLNLNLDSSSSEKESTESELNLQSPKIGVTNVDACSNTPQSLTKHEQQVSKALEATCEKKIENVTIRKIELIDNNSLSYALNINNQMERGTEENKTALDNNDQKTEQIDIQKTPEKIVNAEQNSPEKYKENVVFSVAKINLSEDDNLYSTDSDFSSSRSCDLNERKSMDKEIFTDRMKSVYKDINLSNNEEEKFDHLETNVMPEVANTSNNLECNKGPTTECKDILGADISNQNLTLLDLDSKLESLLDFDEDLDDALSLATSCFASPNDERFEDCIINIDTTNDTTETFKEIPEPEIQPNPSQIRELKHFKIPKLCNPSDSNTTKSINKPEPMEINLCKSSPTKLATQPVLTHNLEKITRTVKNDLVVHLNADANQMLAGKNFENETTIQEKIILKVFGIKCLPYLVDKCFDKTHCQLSHQLNDVEQVYQTLITFDKTDANLAYKILYNHSKLLQVYFNIFCTYYTNKNDRTKLLNMVNDCERYPEYAGFIISIYEGLVKCGLSRVNACRLILKRIRETSLSTSIVETLVAIIMKSDWTIFTDFIEKYTQDVYQFNFRIGILEQMAPAVLNSKAPHLKQVFGKCVQTLHRDDTALLLNSSNLIQCVALLTTNT